MSFYDITNPNPHLAIEALGTAFCIAPGVFASADHVVNEPNTCEGLAKGTLRLDLISFWAGRTQVWTATNIHRIPGNDTVLISTRLVSAGPRDGDFFHLIPTTRSVSVGEEVWICGKRQERKLIQPGEVHLWVPTEISRGQVTDTYPNGAGSLCRAPSFAVDAPALGGSSGGPVLDSEGYVVGVLSRSLVEENPQENVTGYSIVTAIWQTLTRQVFSRWPFDQVVEGSLIERAGNGLGTIERPEAISRADMDGEVRYSMNHWFQRGLPSGGS